MLDIAKSFKLQLLDPLAVFNVMLHMHTHPTLPPRVPGYSKSQFTHYLQSIGSKTGERRIHTVGDRTTAKQKLKPKKLSKLFYRQTLKSVGDSIPRLSLQDLELKRKSTEWEKRLYTCCVYLAETGVTRDDFSSHS